MTQFPTEITAEILSRLPSKPLCRFKTVAKSWNSLISSPIFTKLHYNKTLISQNPNLIISHYPLSIAKLSNNLNFSPINHPIKNNSIEFIGTSNGVVCISDAFKTTLYLLNPETKKHRLIPSVASNLIQPGRADPFYMCHNPFYDKPFHYIVVFGFGYNADEDDYKVLRIVRQCNDRGGKDDVEIRLYSLRRDTWKIIHDNEFTDYYNSPKNGVFVDGCLCFHVSGKRGVNKVKCFDLRDGSITILDMFEIDEGFDSVTFMFEEMEGCLCVMVNYRDVNYDVHGWALSRADFWVMREFRRADSWGKLFSVEGFCGTDVRPVLFERVWPGGAVGRRVLLDVNGFKRNELGWYDWEKDLFERIEYTGVLIEKGDVFETHGYVGSLVSLRSDKEKAMDVEKEKEKETETVKSLSRKAMKKDEKMEKAKEKEKAREKSAVDKKKSDDFLSKGFKLKL